jgi:hypothetical protein
MITDTSTGVVACSGSWLLQHRLPAEAVRRERMGKGRARVCAAGVERWLATALMEVEPQ